MHNKYKRIFKWSDLYIICGFENKQYTTTAFLNSRSNCTSLRQGDLELLLTQTAELFINISKRSNPLYQIKSE